MECSRAPAKREHNQPSASAAALSDPYTFYTKATLPTSAPFLGDGLL